MKIPGMPGVNTVSYPDSLTCKAYLTELSLSRDDKVGYYLSACYRVEDESRISDIYIPKASLPINPNRVFFSHDPTYHGPVCDMGFGKLHLHENSNGSYMWEQVVEEKVHEMTLDEIEKKLGYKVKIVNNK